MNYLLREVKEMPRLKSNNNYAQDLRAGELVEVRGEKEILATLDANGRLAMLPFMPEMQKYCGKTFRVFKRADKTCDTIEKSGLRRMENSVHLEGLRCDGKFHGGCQAGCLLFWKEAWLKRAEPGPQVPPNNDRGEVFADSRKLTLQNDEMPCTEETIFNETRVPVDSTGSDGETYSCQATELRKATSYLAEWDIRQYIRDIKSGNVGLGEFGRGFSVMTYNATVRFVRAVAGNIGHCLAYLMAVIIGSHVTDTDVIVAGGAVAGSSAVSQSRHTRAWAPRVFQDLKGALRAALGLLVEYPHMKGKLRKTPREVLHLHAGETIRVKSKQEILQTLDVHCSNRGLTFNREMLPYCGGQFKVLRRVEKIINEKTGKMMTLPNDCIILDGVTCRAYYHKFCPRNIYPYWREIWLKRVEPDPNSQEAQKSINKLEIRPPSETCDSHLRR